MALDTLWKRLMDMGGGWVLEVDIKAFFDTLVHTQLRAFLDQRENYIAAARYARRLSIKTLHDDSSGA